MGGNLVKQIPDPGLREELEKPEGCGDLYSAKG